MHAMQTMRPLFVQPASPSWSGGDEGWSPRKLWVTLGASVCVHFPPHGRACMCVTEVWSGCSYPYIISQLINLCPSESFSSETVFVRHMVSHIRYMENIRASHKLPTVVMNLHIEQAKTTCCGLWLQSKNCFKQALRQCISMHLTNFTMQKSDL